uniref:SCAN box domain-containing protein n=1 Tax=Mastacembelus armatus TaxID=205130 RepID=A0A7N8XKT2_9TELE
TEETYCQNFSILQQNPWSCGIQQHTYRQRFWSTKAKPVKSVLEMYNCLKGLYRHWMQPESKSKEQIGEMVVLEHYLWVLHPDIHAWVKEHNRQTGEKALELAECYLAAHCGPAVMKGTIVRTRLFES